jgi:hypothetical protein
MLLPPPWLPLLLPSAAAAADAFAAAVSRTAACRTPASDNACGKHNKHSQTSQAQRDGGFR